MIDRDSLRFKLSRRGWTFHEGDDAVDTNSLNGIYFRFGSRPGDERIQVIVKMRTVDVTPASISHWVGRAYEIEEISYLDFLRPPESSIDDISAAALAKFYDGWFISIIFKPRKSDPAT